MFLLIRSCKSCIRRNDPSLHSTMFLLILVCIGKVCSSLIFTFHDVSINTVISHLNSVLITALHSTMFLLIQTKKNGTVVRTYLFTFHDVSINTVENDELHRLCATLHSTMFLLIPVVYSSLQYRYNLTTFCQSCHFIIFILIFIFLDSSHF